MSDSQQQLSFNLYNTDTNDHLTTGRMLLYLDSQDPVSTEIVELNVVLPSGNNIPETTLKDQKLQLVQKPSIGDNGVWLMRFSNKQPETQLDITLTGNPYEDKASYSGHASYHEPERFQLVYNLTAVRQQ